jgi:hypothetical protein
VKLKLEFFILTMLAKTLKKASASGGGMRSYEQALTAAKSKKNMVVVDPVKAMGDSGRMMISESETAGSNMDKTEVDPMKADTEIVISEDVEAGSNKVNRDTTVSVTSG